MNEQIRKLFPNATVSFFDVNPRLCASEREQDQGSALGDQTSGETKSDVRPFVCIITRRVRLLDKDNAYASTKCLTDCLHEIGLIPGDSEKDIELEVRQEKVDHFHEQRTEVKITYP
jgi:hypothetical protein